MSQVREPVRPSAPLTSLHSSPQAGNSVGQLVGSGFKGRGNRLLDVTGELCLALGKTVKDKTDFCHRRCTGL